MRHAVFLFFTLLLATKSAFADLRVAPTRVLLSDKRPTATIELTHIGAAAARYRISFKLYLTNEAGQSIEVENPSLAEHRFAGEYLVFSPKVVSLVPSKSQTVRLSLRRTKGIAPGEYKAHLHMTTFDAGDAEIFSGQDPNAPQDVSMKIRAHRAVAIPVVVRIGDLNSELQLSNLSFKTAPQIGDSKVEVKLSRIGNRSVYGDLVATFHPTGGEPKQLGRINGLSVYNENMNVSIPLNIADSAPSGSGVIKAEFQDQDNDQKYQGEVLLQ
jgi:fimbrial chaperone protein